MAGHCGLPFTRVAGAGALWHNPGAIGMAANDGTPRAWFSLLAPREDGGLEVEHRPLDHDHAAALGDSLWPSCDVLPEAERSARGKPMAPVPTVRPEGAGAS